MFNLNDGFAFQVHGGGEHGGGVSEGLNDLLAFLSSLPGHSGPEVFNLLLPGIAAMANIHPLAVHFPIALLTLFFLVELAACVFRQAQWHTFASGLLYLGTLCAAGAVYLGFQAAESVAHDEAAHLIMEKHEAFGVAILSLAIFLSVWRYFFNVHKNSGVQVLYLLFAAALNLLIVLGADLGGLMVYHHGVSVNAILNSPALSMPEPLSEPAHDHAHGHNHEHGHDHSGHDH
ncbi:MAG: DUF2231 domain-containing protein [Methylococcaceae bacterium]|nr:DUF2231 domain-containing protein [Methylococcaceae bacterium]